VRHGRGGKQRCDKRHERSAGSVSLQMLAGGALLFGILLPAGSAVRHLLEPAVSAEKVGSVPFLNPQTVAVGRVRITVPGPNVEVSFPTTTVNGSKLSWLHLKPGESFAAAWAGRRKKIAEQDDILSDLPATPQSAGVVSRLRTDMKNVADHPTNSVEIWTGYPSGVLQAVSDNNDPTKTREAVTDVHSVIAHFRPEGASVAGPGFQVDGGRLDWESPGGETTSGNVRVPLEKDGQIVIAISTDEVTGTQADDLLARIEHAARELPPATVLKRGPRTVGGLQGHEYVEVSREPELHGQITFDAYFEFGGVGNSVLQPRLAITVDPTHFPATVRAEQLLSLWEAMLDSVHLSR
jgi:hypothetical protein